MRRWVATLWHATFSIAAGILYYVFVLPRGPELMGDISHGLGTGLRIVTGVVIALAALPVVFTLQRTRKPEYGTPQLALTLQTWSIVSHVLAGVLIVGTAIGEIWLSLDTSGQWLFGMYGAAAAIALLGIAGFYLSFVAELPPPPPKPVKPKKEKQRRIRRRRPKKADEAEGTEAAEEEAEKAEETEAEESEGEEKPAEVTAESPEVEPTAVEVESEAQETPAVENVEDVEETATETATVEAPKGGLRNRRPTGKPTGAHRRRRSRRGVAVED
jgi:hypothetical protein